MTHELALIPPAAELPTQAEEIHLQVLQQPAGQLPRLITSMGASAVEAFINFFAASIRYAHTRRAYLRAVQQFLA
jgi:hypothetical protein